jgi:hypothetical protein
MAGELFTVPSMATFYEIIKGEFSSCLDTPAKGNLLTCIPNYA